MPESFEERGSKFLPAFFVDIVEVGQTFRSGDLPLHVTLFPPLQARYEKEFGYVMKGVVNPQTPFEVTVGEEDLFGPEYDVPVFHIEESPQLKRIHQSLVHALGVLLHDDTYRQPYNPHITIRPGEQTVHTGDNILIGGFSIVEKNIRGNWEVVDNIGLKGKV